MYEEISRNRIFLKGGKVLTKKIFLVVLFLACGISAPKKMTDASYECKPALKSAIKQKRVVKKITVTAFAYYRPLRGQKKYATGSYKKEIRLNGKGEETSTGTRPKIGTVAADPRFIPLGTTIWIPGYGEAKVEDTGGAIKGEKIDLFMGEGDRGREKAVQWGKKILLVEILAD